METNEHSIHPLFDPSGFYRLATEDQVWFDDSGGQTIRDFFESRRHEDLREAWMIKVPAAPQDWGFGAPLDEDIHEFLKTRAERARAESREPTGARGVQVRGGGTRSPEIVGQSPALIALRLDRPMSEGDLVPRRAPDDLFSGAGRTPFGTGFTSFQVDALVADDAREPRQCLLLILTREILEHLANCLDRPTGERGGFRSRSSSSAPRRPYRGTEAEAIDVIDRTFRVETLSHRDADEPDRAFRVATLLSMAPALTGLSDADGRFRVAVDLDRESPGLDLGTWVVVCVGPARGGDPEGSAL